ncbi:hypothetical protein ACIP5Y_27425 [Nocardia sp. NPDC088792]|uniref:hypothetical protein n=1 Tax=Nocardia sp. NPDC088792 TaxID=3364332 RepID=UPI0037F93219
MGKCQPVDRFSPRRRIGSLAVAGALPLVAALASAGTAAAEPVTSDDGQQQPQPAVVENQPGQNQPGMVVQTPFGDLNVPVPPEMTNGVKTYLGATAADATPTADTTDVSTVQVPLTHVARNSTVGVRDIPSAPLAPVDVKALHAPDPMSVPDVAPIAAPEGKLRFGDTQVDIPNFLTPDQASKVNALSAGAEAQVARTLDSAGFQPSRSDRIAATTIGTAAQGAAIGVGAAAPLEVAGVLMGGFVGAMAGTPFAPAGWVFGPAVGASAAVGLIGGTAGAIGAGIGAAVGAANGVMAPATPGAPAEGVAPAGAATAG